MPSPLSPAPDPVSERAAVVVLVAAGGVRALGMWRPELAWLGLIATAYALSRPMPRRWSVPALLVSAVIATAFRLSFLFRGLLVYLSPFGARATALAIIAAVVVLEQLPVVVALVLARRPSPRTWLWFAPAWMLGEQLSAWVLQLPITGFLLTQYRVGPVLRALGWVGYYPTLAAVLALAATMGYALATRRWRALAAGVAVMAAAFAIPARYGGVEALRGVAAIRVDRWAESIDAIDGASLVVWPEGVVPRRLALTAEGPVTEVRLAPPMTRAGAIVPDVVHVLGIFNRAAGRLQNGAAVVAADGEVTWFRAKRELFPIGERRYLGMLASQLDEELAPGGGGVVAPVAGRQVGVVICSEVLDRSTVRAATPDGVALLVVLAGDSLIGKDPRGLDLMVAVTALTAAERGVAIARASWKGVAVLVGPDGAVRARADRGHLRHVMLP